MSRPGNVNRVKQYLVDVAEIVAARLEVFGMKEGLSYGDAIRQESAWVREHIGIEGLDSSSYLTPQEESKIEGNIERLKEEVEKAREARDRFDEQAKRGLSVPEFDRFVPFALRGGEGGPPLPVRDYDRDGASQQGMGNQERGNGFRGVGSYMPDSFPTNRRDGRLPSEAAIRTSPIQRVQGERFHSIPERSQGGNGTGRSEAASAQGPYKGFTSTGIGENATRRSSDYQAYTSPGKVVESDYSRVFVGNKPGAPGTSPRDPSSPTAARNLSRGKGGFSQGGD